MDTYGLSVATSPEGLICDSCLDSPSALALPVRRLQVGPNATPGCNFCGEPITPDFGLLSEEDLDY